MKITFLGTSHGVPEVNRFCTSVLLESGGKHYLIDAGAPISDLLIRNKVAFKDISAIFITHLHGDHVDGLVQFADLSAWFYKDAAPRIFTPEMALRDALEAWQDMLFTDSRCNFDYTEIAPGLIYSDDVIKVTAIPTKHLVVDLPDRKRRSYAFDVVSADGKRILFTGDLTHGMTDFPEIAYREHFDIIVVEGAHTRVYHAIDILSPCKTDKMVLSHIAPANPHERIIAARNALPFPFIDASDGQCFEC